MNLTANPNQENTVTTIDHSAPGYLRRTADDYEHHGESTRHILEDDWSGEPGGTNYDPKVSGGGSSDPVGEHVVAADQARLGQHKRDERGEAPSKHPAVLLDRWNKAHKVVLGRLGHGQLPRMLHAYADSWSTMTPARRVEIKDAAQTITDIMNLCRPMPPEIIDKLTNLERRTDDCRACGVPIDKPENRKLGRYDQWCYKRIEAWKQAFPELGAIDDHHAEFCTWIRHHIANRMVGFDRPASIHSPIGRIMVPEDEVA